MRLLDNIRSRENMRQTERDIDRGYIKMKEPLRPSQYTQMKDEKRALDLQGFVPRDQHQSRKSI